MSTEGKAWRCFTTNDDDDGDDDDTLKLDHMH